MNALTGLAPADSPGGAASMNRAHTRAVLYICAERGGARSLATELASEEGHAFAERNDLQIATEIVDPFGDAVPCRRSGWARVREMAENGETDVVIVRWPNALSVDPALRFPELDYLGQYGVQIRYSWAPLTVPAVGGGTG
ncbi:hypothetical protein [Streptomyces chattanoogensis]|uniref:hypothetical protein n=1 Tax=Streptomyces chattanoogensis TaxID=66876 RepID=UPI00367DF3A3